MNLSLLKYFIYTVILFSTFIAHSSNGWDKDKCKKIFSHDQPLKINELKHALKNLINKTEYQVTEGYMFEQVTLDILSDTQLTNAINSKTNFSKMRAWDRIKESIEDVIVKKHINLLLTYTETKSKKLIADTLIENRPLASDKKLQDEFLNLYFDSHLFREWFYKLEILSKLKHIVRVPIDELTQLEQSLLKETEDTPLGKKIYDIFIKDVSKRSPEDINLIKWIDFIEERLESLYELHQNNLPEDDL